MSSHGTHTYENIDKEKVDLILETLTAHGSTITGNNPWQVDTKKHGVKLLGEWDEPARILAITVTDADWYVPGSKVWNNIDELMSKVQDKS